MLFMLRILQLGYELHSNGIGVNFIIEFMWLVT